MKINEIITEGVMDTVKSAWQGAKTGWQQGTGAIPGAIQGYKQGQNLDKIGQQAQDVSAVKANTAGRLAAQWIGTAQSDPNADTAQLVTDLQGYTQKLAGGTQVPAFRGNPLDAAQVTQYMQAAFASADRAKMSGSQKVATTPPPAPTVSKQQSSIVVPQNVGGGPRKSTDATTIQQPGSMSQSTAPAPQSTAPASPQLAPGLTVTNAEPIMFKFNGKTFTLGGQGQWVDSKSSKPVDQSMQAFLSQQHDKFLGL